LIVEEESMTERKIHILSPTDNVKEYQRSEVNMNVDMNVTETGEERRGEDRTGSVVSLFIIYTAHSVLSIIYPDICINAFHRCFELRRLTSSG
jgi:hypothetical protein